MTRKAAVIGKPISHSLSPSIFGFLANRLGVTDLEYTAKEIAPEELAQFVERFGRELDGVGFNVTIPHKESIIPLLNDTAIEAQAIGAVNVVHRTQKGLKGYNTDVYGILRTFEKHGVSLAGKNAIIVGAGGAARAVAYALGMKNAAQVILLTPNQERAHALISAIQPHFKNTRFESCKDWSDLKPEKKSEAWSLIAQSTPLGMSSQPKTREGIPASDYFSQLQGLKFNSEAWAFDLIYRPEWTPFLEESKKQGLLPIGGLNMLIEQALETWRVWFGIKPAAELGDYLRYRPIFLTGFMGAGKSTIGPLLARELGWAFVETDQEIVREAGLSIPEIFRLKGEAYFRDIENSVIQKHAFQPRTVISLGGGSLIHPKTRDLLVKTGRLVLLSADPETLYHRLKSTSDDRPLLAQLSEEERRRKIESLLKEREPVYNLAAFRVDTTSKTPEQAAQEIREKLL
ncbi:MAG: shikimate kinase [Bdellovibrionia bacterium]